MTKKQKNSVDKSSMGQRDQVRFWHAARFEEMECLAARFIDHHYPKHMHDTYSIGVIIAGAEEFHYKGQKYVAPAGSIAALDPHEAHDGYPEKSSGGFVYRMMYPSIDLMADIYRDLTGKDNLPFFSDVIYKNDQMAQRLLGLHAVLDQAHDSLEQDSAFTQVFSEMVANHSDKKYDLRAVGCEGGPIALARQYLDDVYQDDVGLDDLAALTQLNRHYMIRAFKKEVGLTPHAYQTMRRVQVAKNKLAKGEQVIDVAIDCGFYDQSHLNRVFKKYHGITPGQYRSQFGT